MVQVLQPKNRERPSFAQSIVGGLVEGIPAGIEKYQSIKKQGSEKQAVKNKFGEDIANLPKDLQKVSIENDLKGKQAEKEKAAYATFADKLELSHPDDKKMKGIAEIYRSDLPSKDKSQLVTALTGTDIYRDQQQRRLQMDTDLRRYNNRIKEINEEIKTLRFPQTKDKERHEQLNKMRMGLQQERDQLLGFKYLEGLNEDEEEQEIEDVAEDETGLTQFDPSNEKHQSVAKKLMEQYKDKEKVRVELRKKFKGV